MAIVVYLMCVSLYLLKSSHAQTVTLSVTPPSPVMGQEVTLTCTVSPDITTSTSVFYRRNAVNVVELRVTSTSCTPVISQGGQNYIFTCGALPVRQMSLTIPAAYVTEEEHGTDWRCFIFLGATSNTVQLTLRVLVSTVTMTTDGAYRPSVTITAGNTRTFTCTTAASRPVARISWFRGDNNVTDQAGTATDQDMGDDKYMRQQSLAITGAVNDVDSGLKCEAVNIEGRTPVFSQTSNVIVQWEPQTDPSLTRDPPTTTLTEGVSVTLTCRQTGGKPLATLTWSGVCSGTTPTDSSDTTTVTSSVQFSVDRTYNGQTCTCESRHPANSYLETLSETFVVLFGPDTVTITGNQQIVADGVRAMTLTCRTAPYHQYVILTWTRGETTLTGASSPTNTSSANGGTVTSQALTLTPDRTWDGNIITCTAVTIGTTIQRSGSVQLDLLYPPSTPVSVSVNLSTEGRENSTVDLTCHVTGGKPTPSLQWTCPAGVSTTVPTAGSQGDRHTSVITVTLTRQANGQRCSCTGSQTDTTWTGSDQSSVFAVRFGPDNVSVTGNRVVVVDGTNTLTLTCTTQEYNRHVHIAWYNRTTRISNTAVVTNTSGTNRGSVSTQVLQFTPDRYQNGDMIKCVVQNEDVTLAERVMSVTLDIHYRPYLTLTPTPGVKVIEGVDLEIRCDVDSNPAPSNITWSRVGGQLPSNADVTSGVLRIPSTHRTDLGTYRCTAQNSISSEQDSLVIDVQYPSDIHVSYTNTTYTSPDRVLTCVPDGNPDTYQFGEWRHTMEDGTEIRSLPGSSSPTQSVLTLPDPGVTRRYEDTGNYICKVSNNIPVPSYYRSGSVFFVVEAPPVILTSTAVVQGQVGNDVTIIVEFYSRPLVSSSDVTWSRGSAELPPSNRFVTAFGAKSIMTSFHGVNVQVKGYVAVLNINTLSGGDFGDYTVTIENHIGLERYTIALIVTGPPSTPLYLLQKHVTGSSITIQWIPGSDEGQTPKFVIGYRSDITTEYIDLDFIPESRESIMSYTIEGLTSETLYYIRVYAQNDMGMSDILFLNCSTTNVCLGNGDCHDELYSTRTALISVTSIFVIVVVIEVIVFVIFRMRKTPACLKRDNASAKQVHETRQNSGPDNNLSNEHNQLSTYEDLNLVNVSPPSEYEDIRERGPRTSGDNSDGNTYEILGRKAAPNVYEELSKIK